MTGHSAMQRRELHVNGRKFKISRHAARRCAEMGVSAQHLVTILTEGELRRHTPESKHYKDGKGWIMGHGAMAAGLAQDGPNTFTVITVLWKTHDMWHDWFDTVPDTDRKRRPKNDTTMQFEESA